MFVAYHQCSNVEGDQPDSPHEDNVLPCKGVLQALCRKLDHVPQVDPMVATLHQPQVDCPPLGRVVEGEPLAKGVFLLPPILLAMTIRALTISHGKWKLARFHEWTFCSLPLLLVALQQVLNNYHWVVSKTLPVLLFKCHPIWRQISS